MTRPRSRRLARALVLAFFPSGLVAQSPSHPAVDSASVARAAWTRLNAARRAGDLVTARAEAQRAAGAWPTQPAYQWARAVLAARAGDTAGALAGLRAYAALGIGRDLASDSAIAALLGASGFDAVRAAHDRNRAPVARGTVVRQTTDSTLWPEGVDHDPRTGDFYIASVRRRTIVRVAADGSTRELWPNGARHLGALLGVRVDTAVYPGYVVPPYYDSMIAKLIVHARTRETAIARMRRALEAMVVEGIKTTIPLHLKIMNDEKFQKGDFSTKFMEEFKQ